MKSKRWHTSYQNMINKRTVEFFILICLVISTSTGTTAFVVQPTVYNCGTITLQYRQPARDAQRQRQQLRLQIDEKSHVHHFAFSNYQNPESSKVLSKLTTLSASSSTDTDTPGKETTITEKALSLTSDTSRSLLFAIIMSLCGACLGPFLDSYHSAFGVLSYDEPIYATLWGSSDDNPALITAWWVPELFGLAGFIIGWLYIMLDGIFDTPEEQRLPSPPKILSGISFFTFQYWLSGILYSNGTGLDRTSILEIMSLLCLSGFVVFDRSKSGLITSLATAISGPLIEIGLISYLPVGGYHYNDIGETGFFPLWIVPVYFLGGPAVGNLSRGIWSQLSKSTGSLRTEEKEADTKDKPKCNVCNDTRAVGCPNCDAKGYYVTYGTEVKCPACKGKGLVICRNCFASYGDVPNDLENIRSIMSRIPD